jgi:hypothetical protein
LAELINALQAQEQRRLMRLDHVTEGALQAKYPDSKSHFRKNQVSSSSNTTARKFQNKGKFLKRNFPPCQHYNKTRHAPFKCWKRPDAKCSKCNQMGHEAIICRTTIQRQDVDAQVASQDDEDQMFVASCFSVQTTSDHWLIDSGCTNHMTPDRSLFRTLQSIEVAKVRIGNGACIAAKGKGTIAITTKSGTKTISEVLYVPEIDQNLLSVGQLIEKGMKVVFENYFCYVFDAAGQLILQAKMKGKSFSFLPFEEEYSAFQTKLTDMEVWHKRLGHCHQ